MKSIVPKVLGQSLRFQTLEVGSNDECITSRSPLCIKNKKSKSNRVITIMECKNTEIGW